MSDYATLVDMLHHFAERARHSRLTLGDALDQLGEASFAFICIMLALPFLTPISLGPLSTVGGLTLAALGWQILRGHRAPVLPARLRAVEMRPRTWELLIKVCLKVLGFCRKFSRPRHQDWVRGAKGSAVLGGTIMTSGLLMAIPLFGVPLNNVLPALAIMVACLGELEQDGLLALVGVVLTLVSAVYIGAVLLVLFFLGRGALEFMTY